MKPQYDPEKLEAAQQAGLKILLEVDRICSVHRIGYLMDAGTLLGAVRHQGFIPWDDDLDIAMTRADFERFRALCPEELDPAFQLVMPDEYRSTGDENGDLVFYDFTPRILYLNSRRHEDSEETWFYGGKLNHLWVDIFILDNIPDSRLQDRMTRFLQKCIYGLSMAHRRTTDLSKYAPSDRIKVSVLCFFGRLFSMKRLFRLQEKLSVRFNGRETKNFYYSNYQPDYIHDTILREWSLNTVSLPFCGRKFSAPAGYHEVLTEIYGDYMTLPPEEKRVPTHSDALEVWQ